MGVGNRWGDYIGWDQDGDGIGDRPHRVESFKARLLYQYPAVALLLRSPALEMLSHLSGAIARDAKRRRSSIARLSSAEPSPREFARGQRRLRSKLGQVQALDDVHIELAGGKATMLAGPNGAGKTTFMKVLLGLVRPDFGASQPTAKPSTSTTNGSSASATYPRPSLSPTILPESTGARLLRACARRERGRVERCSSRSGWAHAQRRAVRGYSRGMRQRLGLGVAILANPDLLILDEPTAGPRPGGLSVLWSVLDEWREPRAAWF